MGNMLRPLSADIEHKTVALEKHLRLFEIISCRYTRFDGFFPYLRLLQNDIDDASHSLAAIERRCCTLDDLDALDHGGGDVFRARIILEVHRHAVDHDERAPVVAAQRDTSCAEAEILPCLAIGCTR